MSGRFIAFEGGEGAGKSTQIRRLAARLSAEGKVVATTREPGGTPAAENIRRVLLLGLAEPLGPEAEAMLFSAARADHVDRVIRPILDALQVMPAFVYLVPFVALFAASRFTGVIAAVVYAAPVVIKIVADGISGVSPTTMEAATAAGSSTWQLITKVQLPMSRKTLALATNQGLIYVLSMVVIGGLVGAGALGFDVVSGFRQDKWFGKGLAAGLAIVLLGIMLDRITQGAVNRRPQLRIAAG